MKITSIKIEKLAAELIEPFYVAWGVIDKAESWVVKVMTDEGIEGYGSACPTPFITGDNMEICYIALKMLADAVIGMDPLDIEGVHAVMTGVIHGNAPAKCAIDLALYDIWGKKEGQPVYRLLGGTSPVIENDATIGLDTPENMQKKAKNFLSKGVRILKIKVGKDLDTDIEALRLIHSIAGPEVRIRVDANQGYTVESALKALRAFEACGVDAAEQCLPWWDFDGAAEMMRRNDTSVALMLDESIHNIYDVRRAVKLNAAQYINIKLMKCEGLFFGSRMADIAGEHGVKCMVGCMQDDRISLAAGLSLVAAKDAIVEADCDSLLELKAEPKAVSGGFTNVGGIYTLSDEPGLGVRVDL